MDQEPSTSAWEVSAFLLFGALCAVIALRLFGMFCLEVDCRTAEARDASPLDGVERAQVTVRSPRGRIARDIARHRA